MHIFAKKENLIHSFSGLYLEEGFSDKSLTYGSFLARVDPLSQSSEGVSVTERKGRGFSSEYLSQFPFCRA